MDKENEEPKRRPDKKIVLLGDVDVGKTALVRRYKEGIFIPNTPQTLGVCCTSHAWNDSVIALWDTTGQEGLSSIIPLYLKKANAAILCYSTVNRESFESIDKRHSRLLENNVAENCIILLVGTKCDLLKQGTPRAVSEEEGLQKANELSQKWQSTPHPQGLPPFFETSSKNDENVSIAFEYIFNILAPPNKSETSSRTGSFRNLSFTSSSKTLSTLPGTIEQSTDTKKTESLDKEDDVQCCKCC